MRFTFGVAFGILVVRPIAAKIYAPFKPIVQERVQEAAADLGWAIATKIQDKMKQTAEKLYAGSAEGDRKR